MDSTIDIMRLGPDDPECRIESTFRNGSLTAMTVVLGFSLSFLNRWAALSGTWTCTDVVAVAAISIGTILQIMAVALLLLVGSLGLWRYNRAVAVFLAGLAFVAAGVTLAIVGDVLATGRT